MRLSPFPECSCVKKSARQGFVLLVAHLALPLFTGFDRLATRTANASTVPPHSCIGNYQQVNCLGSFNGIQSDKGIYTAADDVNRRTPCPPVVDRANGSLQIREGVSRQQFWVWLDRASRNAHCSMPRLASGEEWRLRLSACRDTGQSHRHSGQLDSASDTSARGR